MHGVEDTTEIEDDDGITITALDEQDSAHYSFLQRWLLNTHLSTKKRTISLRLSLLICVVLLVAIVVSDSYPTLRTITGSIVRSFALTPTPVLAPINKQQVLCGCEHSGYADLH